MDCRFGTIPCYQAIQQNPQQEANNNNITILFQTTKTTTRMRSNVTLILLHVVPLAFAFDRDPLSLPLLNLKRQLRTEGMPNKWDYQTTSEKELTGQESKSKWQNPWKTSKEAGLAIQTPHRDYDTHESLQDQVNLRSIGNQKRRKQDRDDSSNHNIQDSSISTRRRAIPPSETLRQRLRSHQTEQRNLQVDALGTCEEASVYEESEGELYGTSCQCLLNENGNNVTMLCADTACHYCNHARTVCGEFAYGVVFDKEGDAIAFIEQDEYHLGRSDLVVYTDYEDRCTVSINDEECHTCSYNSCANGDDGMKAQCSNLPGGTDYSSCDLNFYSDEALQNFNTGEFEVCLQPDTTPEEACFRDAALEGHSDCICSEDVNVPGRFILHCVDPCAYCDDALSTCGREEHDRFYEPIFAFVQTIQSTVQYSFGRDEQMMIEETGCEEGYDCQACSAKVNGVPCNSCVQQTCSTAEGSVNAAYLDCANIESGAVFDMCREEQIHIDDGVFQYFSGVITDTCVLEGELSCVQARNFFQSPEGGAYACSCELLSDDGSVELSCAIQKDCGEYCNEDVTVCGKESFLLDFEASGTLSYRRTEFAYSLGRNETLVFEELYDNACTFSVDSKLCNSCEVRSCTNEAGSFEAPFLDCSNIESLATFNLCESNNVVQGGIFEYFSSDEFNECVDRTPPNSFCAEAVDFKATAGSTVFGSTELAVFDEVKACVGSASSAGVWYSIVGLGAGVAVSACMPETNFKAQISVYSGGCTALECVTGYVGCDASDEGSASWFADEGTVYHIRVDGPSGATGNVGLKIEDLDITMIACLSKKEEMEAISGAKKSCTCENAGLGSRLLCVDDCDYCDGDLDVCESETQMWRFSRYGIIARVVSTHQYTKGRNETVIFDRSGCTGLSDCQECQVTVNDENCVSCDIVSCSDATQGLDFNCSNIAAGLTTQTTCPGVEVPAGPFEMLLVDEFETCTRDPMRVCQTLALAEENSKTSCSCKEYDNSSIALTCDVTKCQFCSGDDTSCAVRTYGTTINPVGEETGKLEGFTYTMGTNERVLIEEINDGSCRVTVDGEQCNSCQIACATVREDKLSDSDGYQIDCENILAGASFNTCDSVPQTGTFQVFNVLEFDICLPANLDSEAICLSDKVAKEREGSRFRKGTSCQCVESAGGAYILECVDEDCTYCDSKITVCGNNTFGVNYNRFGYQVSTFTGMKYVDGGKDQLVIFEDLEGSCSVTVDNQTCNSCEYKTCSSNDGVDVTGRLIECENVEEVAIFDECEGTFTPGGLLEVFRSPEFEFCHDHRVSAKQVCEDLRVKEEGLDPSVLCECLEEGAYGDYRLACVYLGCLYCNDEKTNCGYNMFATSINRFGETDTYSEGFQYHGGRTDLVEYHQEFDPSLGDLGCSMSVNGLKCSSCELVNCLDETGANTTAISVQCDNVAEGANFNECEATYIEEGPFEYYSDFEFEQCIQVQDPEAVCTAAKNNTEIGDTSGGTTCDCASSLTGGYVMSCEVPECQYCSSDMSQCVLSDLFGVEINKFGEYAAYFDAYDYIVGKAHHYSMEETDEECLVVIDTIECTSCSYVSCFDDEGTEYEDYKIDCSNIDASLVFECHQGGDMFDILVDKSFDVCIPYDAAEAATTGSPQTTLAPGNPGSDSPQTTLAPGNAGLDTFDLLDTFGQSSVSAIDRPSPSLAPISEPNRGPSTSTSTVTISTSTPKPTLSPIIVDSAASELGVRQVLTLAISIAVSAWLIHF